MQTGPVIFFSLMFKLFFNYLDEFLVFRMDNLLIYSQMEEEHLKCLELVYQNLQRPL